MSRAPHPRHSPPPTDRSPARSPLPSGGERAPDGTRDSDPPEPPRLLTVAETAGTLRVHRATVERAIRDGELTPVRIGRRVLIERAEIDRFINERREDRWDDTRQSDRTS